MSATMSALILPVPSTPVVVLAAAFGGAWVVVRHGVGHGGGPADLRGVTGLASRLVAARRTIVRRPVHGAASTADMVRLLDAVSRSLRSGAGVHAALRAAVGVAGVHADALGGVVAALDGGRTLADALGQWRRGNPDPGVSLATAVLTFGLHTGSSVARAVDGAAATLRERLAVHEEVRVLAAQAKASALVVGGAPLSFMVLVALGDPRVASFLLTTSAGWACVGVGSALETVCVLWMRRMVRSAGSL
jgi:tight adherence protein B